MKKDQRNRFIAIHKRPKQMGSVVLHPYEERGPFARNPLSGRFLFVDVNDVLKKIRVRGKQDIGRKMKI